MAAGSYKVVFTGRIAPGADLQQVKARLARLFKTEPARIEVMFRRAPVTIRKGLDEAAARKYVQAIGLAGAIAQAVEAAAGADAPAAAPGPRPGDLSLAPPGARLTEPEKTPEPEYDLSGLSLAPPGADLTQRRPEPEARIDVSGLSLAEPGAPLLEGGEDPPPAKIDTDGLSLE